MDDAHFIGSAAADIFLSRNAGKLVLVTRIILEDI